MSNIEHRRHENCFDSDVPQPIFADFIIYLYFPFSCSPGFRCNILLLSNSVSANRLKPSGYVSDWFGPGIFMCLLLTIQKRKFHSQCRHWCLPFFLQHARIITFGDIFVAIGCWKCRIYATNKVNQHKRRRTRPQWTTQKIECARDKLSCLAIFPFTHVDLRFELLAREHGTTGVYQNETIEIHPKCEHWCNISCVFFFIMCVYVSICN